MTLFVLLGPTAVGKTQLSLQLARHLDSPILNADSRQLYRDIPICTAAPTQEQMALVPHHFVGTLSLTDSYSAARYEAEVLALLEQQSQNCLLSGGSMMYIDAVCRGIDDMPQADPAIRQRLRDLFEAEGLQPLLAQLRQLDPDYAAIVDSRNPQRVIHGLEMCLTTGRPFSQFRTGRVRQRPFRIVKIGLRRDREELYRRIDQRVEQMFSDGLEAETLAVYTRFQQDVDTQFASVIRNPGPTQAQPIPNLMPVSLNTVGLREMLLHYAGIWSLDQACERICHNSRIYSKKQMTWFQRDPSIRWFHPDDCESILAYVRDISAGKDVNNDQK